MSQSSNPPVKKTRGDAFAVAALVFELIADGDGVTTEAHLLPPGPFRAVDGRPTDCAAWLLSADIASRVIARAKAKANDTLIDFEHQSLRTETNGKRVEAAGWFRDLEWREGLGLYATNIQWVGDTAQLIKDKKLRYHSAVFLYSAKTGEVLEIISVALTNTPAIDGLDALADLARKISSDKDHDMATEEQLAALTAARDTLQAQLAALTTEASTLKTSVAALTAERDQAVAKLTSAEQEKAQAALAAEKTKHAELLTAALTDGRLVPAQKPWAEKQSLAALTEFLDASKPLPLSDGRQGGKGDEGTNGLSEEEMAMCTRMNTTPEDYIKAKGQQAKAGV